MTPKLDSCFHTTIDDYSSVCSFFHEIPRSWGPILQHIAIENHPVEIVDFPSYKMVDLSSSHKKNGDFPMKNGGSFPVESESEALHDVHFLGDFSHVWQVPPVEQALHRPQPPAAAQGLR